MTTDTMTKQPKFTAETAQQFDGISMTSVMILTAAAHMRGCTCEPYTDWFTFNRWLAQGMAVKKGEHGQKLSIFIHKTKETADGKTEEYSIPWTTTVFCRCQVHPVKVTA